MNFEKYNNLKPTQEIRRKIANLFLEFQDNKNNEEFKGSFMEICQTTQTKEYIFLGYILNNAYSQTPDGWNEIFVLIVEYLYSDQKLFSTHDLIEG